jgi:hypothetical protein
MKKRIIAGCDPRFAEKENRVGLSFYAFFAKKNDVP